MAFMEKQVTEKSDWYEIDGTEGTVWVPADVVGSLEHAGDYYAGEIWTVEARKGYGARLSAPGYMDCTDWCVFDTEAEAEKYLEETYPDDDE